MSLILDLQALRTRFNEEWDADAITTVFANAGAMGGEAVDVVQDEPFVRFTISPGSNFLTYGDGENGLYTQLGRAILQVFTPRDEGITTAYEIAETFASIFRYWKSDDGCLRVLDYDITSNPSGEDGFFQVNVSVRWESLRRP